MGSAFNIISFEKVDFKLSNVRFHHHIFVLFEGLLL